jgi:hypothetical protein
VTSLLLHGVEASSDQRPNEGGQGRVRLLVLTPADVRFADALLETGIDLERNLLVPPLLGSDFVRHGHVGVRIDIQTVAPSEMHCNKRVLSNSVLIASDLV